MSKSNSRSPTLVMALLATVLAVRMPAQTPPTSLVIEGGTLIDGNGGTPVREAVIVTTGNKIASVSRKGQLSYPPNAQVIKAGGKFGMNRGAGTRSATAGKFAWTAVF